MDDELRGVIFGALGQASMCWEPQPGGVFDSVEATKIGEDIIQQIEKYHVDHSLKHTLEVLEFEYFKDEDFRVKVRVDSSAKYGTQIFWLKSQHKIVFDVEGVATPHQFDLLEAAWGLLANVSNGNWEEQLPTWQEAASRWRDRYHEKIDKDRVPEFQKREVT